VFDDEQLILEKLMKSVVLTVTLLCAAGAANAQALGPPPASSGDQAFRAVASAHNINQLAALLDLDAGQKGRLKEILDEQVAEMEALAQEPKASGQNPSFEQMQVKLSQLQKHTHEQLGAILTDTQLKKFEAAGQHTLSTGVSTGLVLQAQSAGASCDSLGRCKDR
jgi:hypothetical protein